MAEIPKQDSDYVDGLGRMMNGFRGSTLTVKTISVSDQMMNSNSDAFVVDLESFSNGRLDKDVTASSRINMLRSYSKKGYPQGGKHQESLLVSSSPRAVQAGCNSTPEKLVAAYSQPPVVVSVGATDPSNCNNQATVKTKSRWARRYNSFKRSPPPHWFSDPKRVLLFFATLSSLGTLLLIYFTLSTSNSYEYDINPEWQP